MIYRYIDYDNDFLEYLIIIIIIKSDYEYIGT